MPEPQVIKIGFVTITGYAPVRYIKLLFNSIRNAVDASSLSVTIYTFIHARNLEAIQTIRAFQDQYDSYPNLKVKVYGNGTNRGVARSWNDGLLYSRADGNNVHILTNDDLQFSPDDIENLTAESIRLADLPYYGVMIGGTNVSLKKNLSDHGFACIAIQPVALETIGMFDENFFPAYNEDEDYSYRAKLAKLQVATIPGNVIHIGSASIHANEALNSQNNLTHYENDRYWWDKWGCMKGEVGFSHPFNDEFVHPYEIKPGYRNNPYGKERDRTDRGIVII